MTKTKKIRDLKDEKKFVFTMADGSIVNKFGKNIEVYEDGVFFKREKVFVPREWIIEVKELNL